MSYVPWGSAHIGEIPQSSPPFNFYLHERKLRFKPAKVCQWHMKTAYGAIFSFIIVVFLYKHMATVLDTAFKLDC